MQVLAITLDKTRNQLIKLNLVATTGAFVAAVGSMAASLFGMNLHVEEFTARALPDFPQDALFPTVTISILGASALFATGFVRWLVVHLSTICPPIVFMQFPLGMH